MPRTATKPKAAATRKRPAKRKPMQEPLRCRCVPILMRDNSLERYNLLEGETVIFKYTDGGEDLSNRIVLSYYDDNTWAIGRGPAPGKASCYFVAIRHTWLTAEGQRVEFEMEEVTA